MTTPTSPGGGGGPRGPYAANGASPQTLEALYAMGGLDMAAAAALHHQQQTSPVTSLGPSIHMKVIITIGTVIMRNA